MEIYPRALTEALYIKDDVENVAVRTDPETKKIFLKEQGGEEREAQQGENLYLDAMLRGEEITEAEYQAY